MSEQLSPSTHSEAPNPGPHPTGATEVMPTAETPTRETSPHDGETFIYHDEEFARPDPDKSLFDQLKQEAENSDNKGMVGLEWIGKDGLRYRVSSHEKLTRVRQGDPKKHRTKSLLPRIAHHPLKGPEIRRKTVDDPVEEEVDYRTVDVIDENGDIVDIKTFTGYRREWDPTDKMGGILLERLTGIEQGEYDIIDNFKDYFEVGAHINPASPGAKIRVPREILGFRWAGKEKEPAIASRGTVAGPEVNDWDPKARLAPENTKEMKPKTPEEKTQELFERLAEQQAALGLGDWRGLTWSTPFPTVEIDKAHKRPRNWHRDGAEQMQIVRDIIIFRNADAPGVSYPERVFEVRTTSADGIKTINRHIYTLEELMLQFSRREARERKVNGLRTMEFNLPSYGIYNPGSKPEDDAAELARRENAISGRKQFRLKNTHATGDKAKDKFLPPSPMDWFVLSALYEELGETDQRGPELNLRWETPEPTSPAKTSSKAKDIESEKLNEVLDKLRSDYLANLHALGADPHHKPSTTWIEVEMKKSRNKNRGNPFEDSRLGSSLRSQIIARRLGVDIVHSVREIIPKPESKTDEPKDSKATKPEYMHLINPLILSRIGALLYKEGIEKLLKLEAEGKEEHGELKLEDLEELGRMVQLSLGLLGN